MRALYERVLETDVYGQAQVPPFGGYIVAANHASHLDTGLVKYALGEQGDALVALAAKDYFFDDPVRRMYFENFTNLVPMERHGSLRESLRLAGEVIRDGYILLIFPEGTRSDTGVMIGLQAVARLPRDDQQVRHPADVPVGDPRGDAEGPLPAQARRAGRGLHRPVPVATRTCSRSPATRSRSEQYRAITYHVEAVIRRLAPRDQAWTLGDAGTTPMAEWLAAQGKPVAEDEAQP